MRKVLIGLLLLSANIIAAQTYTVTTVADSGPGSLRDAITEANAGNYDRIIFNVSPASTGTDTIFVNSDLPTIFVTLEIDGTTESGFTTYHTPRIILRANDPSCNFGIGYAGDSLSVLKSIGIYYFNQGIIHSQKKSIIDGVYFGHSQYYASFNGDSCIIKNCVFGYSGEGANAGTTSSVFLGGKGIIFGGQGKENVVANVKGNALLLMTPFVSCYENIFRDTYTTGFGPDFFIYAGTGITQPIIGSYVVNASTIDLQGAMGAGDTIFVMMTDKEYSSGPVVYKTTADASGNWSFSLPKPANKNLKFYLGRRNSFGASSPVEKCYSIGEFYDTLLVTNTSSDQYTPGSLPFAFRKAIFGTGNKRIEFAASITLSTPIALTTSMNSSTASNTGNIIIDGDGRVELQVPGSAGTAFTLNKSGTVTELRGIRFNLLGEGSWVIFAINYSKIISCSFYNCSGYAIRSSQDGVYVDDCKFWDVQYPIITFVKNDTIINSSFGERYLPYAGGYSGVITGITCRNASDTYIANNTFKNNGGLSLYVDAAIRMEEGAKRFRIENNRIENVNGTGIHIGATHGFYSYGTLTNSIVQNNYISGAKNYGIYIKSSDSILVKGNHITCTDSIALEVLMSSRIKFSENTFSSQKGGIHCWYDYYDYATSQTYPTNNNKPAPVITSYTSPVLSGTSENGDTVEVFLNDASVNASAIKYLGKAKAIGGTWSIAIPEQWQGGSYVAIATDMNGNTSPLSNIYSVAGEKNIYVVRSIADTGCYCLRAGIETANNNAADYINFDLNNTNVIKVPTRYPVITAPVTIDATSQTGYSYTSGPGVVIKYDSIAMDISPDCYTSFKSVAFTGLEVNTDNVMIRGLGMDGFKRALYLREGTNSHTIKACAFTNGHVQNTVDLWSSHTLLDSCSFTGNRFDATSQGCPPNAVGVIEQSLISVKGDNNSISNNTFTNNVARYHFLVETSNQITVNNNNIAFNEYRFNINRQFIVYARQSSDISIHDNIITPAVPSTTVITVHADTVTNINVTRNSVDKTSDPIQFTFVKNGKVNQNTFKVYGVPAWVNNGVTLTECDHIIIDTNSFVGTGNTIIPGTSLRISAADFASKPTDSVWVRDNVFSNYEGGLRLSFGPVSYVEIRRNKILKAYFSALAFSYPTIQNDGITPPVVTKQVIGNSLVFSGVSTPGFLIEIFKGGFTGPQVNIEEFIGDATADASGNWTYTVPASHYNPFVDQSYMATVTGLKRNTSEFSAPILANADLCAAAGYRYWNGHDSTSCPNDTITLAIPVAPGNTIAWTGPNGLTSATSSIKATKIGTYLVEVTDATATCSWKDSIYIDYKLGSSIPDFLIADKAGPGETLIAVEITWPLVDSSSWNFYGSPYVQVGSYYQVTYANAGTYQVTMRAHLDACYEDVTKTVTIDPAYAHQVQTVSPGANDIASVIVKPNPTDGRFELEILLNSKKDVTVDWLNASNHTVERIWNYTDADHYEDHIDVTPLSPGIYLLRVYTADDARIIKVVVQ